MAVPSLDDLLQVCCPLRGPAAELQFGQQPISCFPGNSRATIAFFNLSHKIHYPEQMFDIMDITDSH
jgi:hypothetical protein